MKEMNWILLLIVISSSLVMAGSEISTSFVVGEKEVVVDNYVPAGFSWNNYINYTVVVLIIFAVGYFLLKMRGEKTYTKKKNSKRKVRKRK